MSIRWYCATCRCSIGDGEGFLGVSFAAIREAMRGDGSRPAAWLAYHDRCAVEADAGYWIDVAELRSGESMLAWTRHLARKSWLRRSTWDLILELVVVDLVRAARRRAA